MCLRTLGLCSWRGWRRAERLLLKLIVVLVVLLEGGLMLVLVLMLVLWLGMRRLLL